MHPHRDGLTVPSVSQHQAKYKRNRAFLNSGVVLSQPEWGAVVAFYSAVHLVEKLAALDSAGKIHHRTHVQREIWLRTHRRFKAIYNDYETLKDASLLSRYGTINQFEQAYDSASVQSQLIDVHLAAIEAYVHLLTSPPGPPATES